MKNSSRNEYLARQKERQRAKFEERKKAYEVSKIKEYPVREECELLDFLLKNLKGQSRNNIKNLLSHKLIAVDGTTTTQFNYKLYKGDTVQLSKTPLSAVKNPKKVNKLANIIYEDNEIIVINKPSGLLTVANDKEKTNTAYHKLMEYVQLTNVHNRVFAVHRIDKDTSGVLMVCKNDVLKNKLQDNWNNLVTIRKYIAVCEGIFEKKEGTVRHFLKETKTNVMYNSGKEGDGLESITHYKVIKESKNYSLLEVYIDSGRKNQIRVAMESLNHPIVGDNKYGNASNPLNRLGLHNQILELKHPYSGKILHFEAPIPQEFFKLFGK